MKLNEWPIITDTTKDLISTVLENYGETDYTGMLERDFMHYLDGISLDSTVAVSSCTHALHIAYTAVGIGPGDEVITTPFTFHGTTHPLLYLGATPVFVDIDAETYNIDPEKIEEKITERTKAIVPVHLHGLPADMWRIMPIANHHNLIVIEDACQAHGASITGRRVGTFGHLACFSLSKVKNMPGDQGGLIVTNSYSASTLRGLANYGEPIPPRDINGHREYIAYRLGYSYGISEFSAAMAIESLEKLDERNNRAQDNAEVISKELEDMDELILPKVPAGFVSVWHKYRLQFKNRTGKDIAAKLLARGIRCERWQALPLDLHPLYEGNADCPIAYEAIRNSLCLFDERHPLVAQTSEIVAEYSKRLKKELKELLQ